VKKQQGLTVSIPVDGFSLRQTTSSVRFHLGNLSWPSRESIRLARGHTEVVPYRDKKTVKLVLFIKML